MQIPLNFQTSYCNLKIWQQNCVWLFYCFNFEKNYDVLKSKSLGILLNQNINFNKNETESKMENPSHSFRETNLVLQLIEESESKSRTVMSSKSRKKEEGIFCTVYFVQRNFFKHMCFISMYGLLNTLSEYTYFYISKKHYFIHFFACF